MFDDLIDPDPPRPGLETLANVSERARRMRRRRDATRVLGLGAVAGLLVGSLAFVIDGDPDQPSEIAESLDTSADVAIDVGELLSPTTPPTTETRATVSATGTTESPAASGSLPVEQTTTTTTRPLPIEPIPFLAVGDQVMLGAAGVLTERGMAVDAAASRQIIDVIPMLSSSAVGACSAPRWSCTSARTARSPRPPSTRSSRRWTACRT